MALIAAHTGVTTIGVPDQKCNHRCHGPNSLHCSSSWLWPVLSRLGDNRGLLEHHAAHNVVTGGCAVDCCGRVRIVGHLVWINHVAAKPRS